MASADVNSPGQRQSEIQTLVRAAAGGKSKPVYLFAGEPFQTAAAAKTLIDALVPEANRSFNLEMYDGRTTPMAQVLDSVRMRGFFSGTKVVWVRETTVFLSGEKRGDVTKSMLSAWSDGRQSESMEKLLALVALAAWSQDQFVSAQWSSLPKTRVKEVFGDELGATEMAQVSAIHAACLARDLAVGTHQDDSALLLTLIDAGLPPDVVLVLTASTVDARKRLFKRIAEVGVALDLSAERDRSGALSRETVDELVSRILKEHGKRLQADAHDLVLRRAGSDLALVVSELEKLCLTVGDRPQISADDVRRSMLDLAESWIFDFTAALGGRQIAAAVTLLRGLMEQGEPALRLLAMIAREVRLLLVARECLDGSLRGVFRADLAYPAFQSKVLPRVDAETSSAFGKAHPFVLYKRFQDAARMNTRALRQALIKLAEIDVRLKSSRTDPGMLLEAFVIDWCRSAGERRVRR